MKTIYRALLLAMPFLALFTDCKKEQPYTRFQSHPAQETGVNFVNQIPEETPNGMNFIQYLYYYNGGGVATGDLNNDGLPDLFFISNLEGNRLYFNKGNFQFEDVSGSAGIEGTKGTWNTGVSLADVNADGWLDIYVCRVGRYKQWNGKNQLFINQKNGTFIDQAAEYGLDIAAFSTQANFTDVDNDGDLDCFLLCHSIHSPGSYRDTSQTRKKDPLAADRLFLCTNTAGKITYSEASDQYSIYGGTAGYGLGTVAGDFNGDHFTDIYVANDFHENDYLYINQQGKGFKESIAQFTGHTSNFSMGCDLADFNNDALPDLISLDMKPNDEAVLKSSQPADLFSIYQYKHGIGYHWQFSHNALQLNQTPAPDQVAATEIAYFAGIAATEWSWSALFADLDLDGWKDLHITNGIVRRPNDMDYIQFTSSDNIQRNATDRQLLEKMPNGAMPNYCFQNNGDLAFNDVSALWGLNEKGCSNGAAYADLDLDGDLDLITNNINAPASIYENTTIDRKGKQVPVVPMPHFLVLKLKGKSPNTFGIGTKVWAYSGDTVQYLEHQPVRGFQSCMEPGVLYLGCGNLTQLDSVLIRWPDGTGVTLRQVGTNETLTIKQENTPIQIPEYGFPSLNLLQAFAPHFPTPADAQLNFPEKLQPWALNDGGPKPAIGKDWLFVPGNEGGDLYRITLEGTLQYAQSLPYTGKGICAALADIDGDQQEDLYIGIAPSASNLGGKDCLYKYRNGHWEPAAPEALPVWPINTGCVAFADIDGDGDLDLFAGGRSDPTGYGVAPASYLLENDGKGHFRDITETKAPKLNRLGMLTDAWFGDMNNDNAQDLVLCGEWMAIHIFYNVAGTLTGMSIPESSGLWNALSIADFDSDGDMDIVAGNFGTNSILKASREQPLELWVKDFDQNMQVDPVMAYYRNGEQRPLWDKDLLLSQMPFLKKRYVSYHKYAQDKMDQIFDASMQKETKVLRVERLQSSYFEQGKSGLWSISALAAPFQWSTVNAIGAAELDGQPGLDLWIGGNTFQVNPTIGRMDALPLTHAANMGRGQFVPILTEFSLQGAVRSIIPHREGKALVTMSDGRVFVLAI